ncbi:MAG: hypothetical protein OIF56_02110 [Cohaesibacter sp.]|nr:hypothetical protein [Cohaesibacter sp.]
MTSAEELKEKLSLYLSSLSDSAQQLLLRTLEKSAENGKMDPSSQLILDALKHVLKADEEEQPEQTVALDPLLKEAFFAPAKPFIAPLNLASKSEGRVSPDSLDAIWRWIKRDIAEPDQLALINKEAVAPDKAVIAKQADQLRALLLPKISKTIKIMLKELAGEQKMANQLGSSLVYKDLMDFMAMKEKTATLQSFLKHIDQQISSWESPKGEEVYAQIRKFVQQFPMQTAWLFSGLTSKLSEPKLLVQLSAKLAGSEDALQIGATVYAPAITQILVEMEAHIFQFKAKSATGKELDSALQSLAEWRKLIRALETELEIPVQCPWAKSLSAMKTEMSDMLEKEISTSAGLIRKALRAPKEGTAEVADENLLQDATRAAQIFHHAERMKDSLAINEIVRKVRKELDQTFEVLTKSLVERTRHATGADVEICKTLGDAAVIFATHLVDEDYANSFQRQLKAAATSSELKETA